MAQSWGGKSSPQKESRGPQPASRSPSKQKWGFKDGELIPKPNGRELVERSVPEILRNENVKNKSGEQAESTMLTQAKAKLTDKEESKEAKVGKETQELETSAWNIRGGNLNVVLERPVDHVLNEQVTENMQVEEQSEVLEETNKLVTTRRSKTKTLRTPVIKRKLLADAQKCGNSTNSAAKRKFHLVDEVMEDAIVTESVGKKGKREADQASSANFGEGEVTSPTWSPMDK